MDDITRLSVAELEAKQIVLNALIDELAVELAELNKELLSRSQKFRAQCFTPVEALKVTQPTRRGVSKPRD